MDGDTQQRTGPLLGVRVLELGNFIAGPFAAMGAFMSGRQTVFRILYLILFAPVIEELLKQSGMIYLLEKKPYRIFSGGQFIVAAIISAGVFASIENLLYIHFYSNGQTFESFSDFCCFRWGVCTSLHVVCSVIASFTITAPKGTYPLVRPLAMTKISGFTNG